MDEWLKRFVPPEILSRKSYTPGFQPKSETNLVKLNTNENPYPPSSSVANAVLEETKRLQYYPEPTSSNLRKLIAEKHQLEQSQVIIGNGSDDLLNLCVRAFSDSKRSVGMLNPSYSLYPTLTSLQRSNLALIEFTDDRFELPMEEIISSGVNLFFLTNPHAPSGLSFPKPEIAKILNDLEAILVVDEAYADFADDTSISLLSEADNLIITRTFSKSYSLAGSRVGYALSSPQIIEVLDNVREVYNLDRMSQAAACAALSDKNYFEDCMAKILTERQKAHTFFTSLGWRTVESQANFIFTEPVTKEGEVGKEVAKSLFKYLESQNVFVRYFSNHRLTESKIRISIGTKDQMITLIQTIKNWLNENS
jgi:histidinol-phosphate aminotransferase